MSQFPGPREAKEFLVARIVAEARLQRVSLSDIERKMLYFSETGWTLPDIVEVNSRFVRDYDSDEYERKISQLVRSARRRARMEDRAEFAAWSDAFRALRKEDHYLLVMIDKAGLSRDHLRLWLTGISVVCMGFGLLFLLVRFRIEPTREALAFIAWITITCVAAVCIVLYLFLGRQRAEKLISRVTGKALELFDQSK